MASPMTYVLSDAHLGEAPEGARTALHRFIDAVPVAGDHLLINGDLFDFWFEYASVIPRSAFPTLACLARMRARGVGLTVIGGNHDRWGLGFWESELGAAFFAREAELVLAGRQAYVAHGDGLAERRTGPRVLQRVTRHPVTAKAFRWIHPDLGLRLVGRLSGLLGERTRDAQSLELAAAGQREWAVQLLERRTELELVILGHTHRPALVAAGEGRWYVNPGAWMDGFGYAALGAGDPELRSYRFQ